MNSPFPGMDPYLEKHWRDIHASLIIYARDQLQGVLPAALCARVEERVFLESEGESLGNLYPDVRVVEYRAEKQGTAEQGNVATLEPLLIHVPLQEITETYIEILDAESGNRVITVIEILSLTNKTTRTGRKQYREKQKQCKKAGVSLVEIDLLRAGRRVLSVPPNWLPRAAQTLYQVCVYRAWKADVAEVYPVPLENPLPSIRIPLRPQDQDVRLHLQELLAQAYRNGRYGNTLDYRVPLDPPLPAKEAKWAKGVIKRKNAK